VKLLFIILKNLLRSLKDENKIKKELGQVFKSILIPKPSNFQKTKKMPNTNHYQASHGTYNLNQIIVLLSPYIFHPCHPPPPTNAHMLALSKKSL
jgi:hypothetical protein